MVMIVVSLEKQFLDIQQVLDRITHAADNRIPFSLVRLGDGKHIVLAQNSVWPMERVLQEEWAVLANQGEKGVTLPNLQLRDEMVEAVRKADIVGILAYGDTLIDAPAYLKRELSDQIFQYFDLHPAAVCDATINRFFPYERKFWALLKGRKIALVSRWALELKELLIQEAIGLNIAFTITLSSFEQIKPALDQLVQERDSFDIALVSGGCNAVILAQKIAECTGKIGIDFGKSAEFLVQGKVSFQGGFYID